MPTLWAVQPTATRGGKGWERGDGASTSSPTQLLPSTEGAQPSGWHGNLGLHQPHGHPHRPGVLTVAGRLAVLGGEVDAPAHAPT